MPPRRASLAVRCALPFLLVVSAPACGGPPGEKAAPGADPVPTEPPAPSPRWELEPAWTSSDTLLLSGVHELAVDSRGRVYAFDRHLGVVRLSPTGEARLIGRIGEGPGEYQWVADLRVGPADTVRVWDSRARRLSVLEPDSGRLAYTRSFPEGVRRRVGERSIMNSPQWVHRLDGFQERYLAEFRPLPPIARRGDEEGDVVVRMMDDRGSTIRDSVLLFPVEAGFGVQRGERSGSFFSAPFAARGIVRIGPDDRIYFAWTDTTRIRVYEPDGRPAGGFAFHRDRHPVTEEELEDSIDWYVDTPAAPPEDAVEKGIRESAPERHPAFEDVLVDDRGRVWIAQAYRESAPDRPFEWEVYSPAGHRIGIVPVERGALRAVRNGRAYGVWSDSLGVPAVWAARIIESGEQGAPASETTSSSSPVPVDP